MKCNRCGYESTEVFAFCPVCGAQEAVSQPFNPMNPLMPRMVEALKSNLFLIICILLSASSVLLMVNGGLPVINILLTIFCWLTYAAGQRELAEAKYIRGISGTVYATYVVNNVAYGLLIGSLALVAVLMFFVGSNAELTQELMNELMAEIKVSFPEYTSLFTDALSAWIGVVFALLMAVCVGALIINIIGVRSIHRFIQSVYKAVEHPQGCIVKANAAKTWLMVCGILEAVSAVSNFSEEGVLMLLGSGAYAAAMIVGSIWVKKYFAELDYTC